MNIHDISGIRRTSETNVWQLSSLGDLMKGNKDSNMPMKRVSLTDVSETLLQSNSRASFRDYEKKPTNRKSLCFLPILENCLIAEDSLNLGQRFVFYMIAVNLEILVRVLFSRNCTNFSRK